MSPNRRGADREGPAELADYLSAAQVAELLNVTASRVGQLRREHVLPAVRTPLGYLYHRPDVNKLLASRERHPTLAI